MGDAAGRADRGRTGPLTLRWREARAARGVLRLAQRVRSDLDFASVPGVLAGVAAGAYADEFCIEWHDGGRIYVSRDVLDAWVVGGRPDLPEIPNPLWEGDLLNSGTRALAVDGMRIAVARLLASGVIDDDWADDIVRRVHVAAQSLPASSFGAWRS